MSTGRADIARPWTEHAEQAGSLFAWGFGLTAAGLLLLIEMGAAGVVLVFAVRDGRLGEGEAFGVGLLLLLPILLLAMLALSLVLVALRDFVAPLQMLHKTACRPALETFLGILRAQPGVFVVYVMMKIAFAVAVATAGLLVGCLTCCLGFLPVVMQTLLQPAFYFERAWSLCLLRQAGHDTFAAAAPAAGGGLDALRAPPPPAPPAPPQNP